MVNSLSKLHFKYAIINNIYQWRHDGIYIQSKIWIHMWGKMTSFIGIEISHWQFDQVWDIGHMQHINILGLCVLHWVHILHTRYVTCFCPLIWSTTPGNQIFFSGHFTNFPYIYKALVLRSLRFAYSNMFYYWLSCYEKIPHVYYSGVLSHPHIYNTSVL